ncbi:MAG TPA: acyl-CoA dehydrogenase family protein, partial [Candidatus Anoxymicrobiaceae bacterium]
MDFSFTEEQELMAAAVREFCEKEITSEKIREWEETLDFMPQEVWDKAAALGLFAASVPEEFGGEGADMVSAMVGFEEISKASTSVALGVGATIGFGTRPIVELGTEDQK